MKIIHLLSAVFCAMVLTSCPNEYAAKHRIENAKPKFYLVYGEALNDTSAVMDAFYNTPELPLELKNIKLVKLENNIIVCETIWQSYE